eukprot:3706024-Amphidinium_carterae.4
MQTCLCSWLDICHQFKLHQEQRSPSVHSRLQDIPTTRLVTGDRFVCTLGKNRMYMHGFAGHCQAQQHY